MSDHVSSLYNVHTLKCFASRADAIENEESRTAFITTPLIMPYLRKHTEKSAIAKKAHLLSKKRLVRS